MYFYDDIFPALGEFSKAERLDYHESVLTHAMTFTGVNLDENGKALEWQVENSWGDENGKKGITLCQMNGSLNTTMKSW